VPVTVWIDPPRWPAHSRLWSHVISDQSYDELHDFAARTGIPARSFDGDHYDVPQERYAALVAAGAQPIDGRDLARRLRDSGLRFQKRKGDRPLASYRGVLGPALAAHTLHVVASRVVPPDQTTAAAAVFVRDAQGSMLLVRSVVRDAWGAPAGGRERGESVHECAVREVWEETGLVLDRSALWPCGYERIVFDSQPTADPAFGRWPHRRNHVAVFATTIEAVRPPVRARLDDVDEVEWVDFTEVERRCRDAFWWPLLAASDPWSMQ